jgi:hypothetical protein
MTKGGAGMTKRERNAGAIKEQFQDDNRIINKKIPPKRDFFKSIICTSTYLRRSSFQVGRNILLPTFLPYLQYNVLYL